MNDMDMKTKKAAELLLDTDLGKRLFEYLLEASMWHCYEEMYKFMKEYEREMVNEHGHDN